MFKALKKAWDHMVSQIQATGDTFKEINDKMRERAGLEEPRPKSLPAPKAKK